MMRVGVARDEGNAADVILDAAVGALNSNERFSLDDSFEFNSFHIGMPGGGARRLLPKK